MKVLPTFCVSPVTTFYYLIILNPWVCNEFLPLKIEIALSPAKNGFAEWPEQHFESSPNNFLFITHLSSVINKVNNIALIRVVPCYFWNRLIE